MGKAYHAARTWCHTFLTEGDAAARVYVQTLPHEQQRVLAEGASLYLVREMANNDFANALPELLQLPHLTTMHLQRLAGGIGRTSNLNLTLATVKVVLRHPLASEVIAQEVCFYASCDTTYPAVAALVIDLGWDFPLALQLSGLQHRSTSISSPALALVAQLTYRLKDLPPPARAVVHTLGRTWKGTVDALFATAQGILA